MTWLDRTPDGVTVEYRPYGVANCGRTWTRPGAAPRVTLHTTESPRGSMAGVLGLWDQAERNGTLTVPHFTIDPGTQRIAQHRDLLGPACALEGCNAVSTNGVPNVQVEICGYATESPAWADADLAFIGDWLAAVKASGFDVPLTTPVTFYSDRNAPFILASYTSPNRIPYAAWDATTGVIGHQHVPCNAHWDPGGVNVGRILFHAAARLGGQPNPGGLTVSDVDDLKAMVSALSKQMADMQQVLGIWLGENRLYEGLAPVKKPNDPAQWLVLFVPGRGFVKAHVPGDAGAVPVLQAQGTLQSGPADLDDQKHPVPFKILRDPAQQRWLDSLPEA